MKGFETIRYRLKHLGLFTENQGVGGSNPPLGTSFNSPVSNIYSDSPRTGHRPVDPIWVK